MARPFFALLSVCLLLSACTKRVICPAFQSAYIYDKEALRKKFSYFLEDSTPKILTASKTKYLIAEPVTYRKKLRSLSTIEMKDVNPVLPDSMKVGEEGLMGEDGVVPGAELDLAARSVIDSTYIVDVPQDTVAAAEADSVYMISKDKELRLLKYDRSDSLIFDESSGSYALKTPEYEVEDIRFNVEQDNYMWYLRKNLVLPDVRLAQVLQDHDNAAPKKDRKGIKGFFKNLFKKKKKTETDSVAVPPAEEFDYVDDNEGAAPVVESKEEPRKKSPFSFLKKKEQDVTAEPAETTSPKEKRKKKKKEKNPKEGAKPDAKEEGEEDDGF